jgi:hypothetical protein
LLPDIIGSELISYNPTLFDLTEEAEGSESTSLFPGEAEKLLQADEPSGLDAIAVCQTHFIRLTYF